MIFRLHDSRKKRKSARLGTFSTSCSEFKVGDNGEGVPVGLLKARKALVFTTSNTPREREREVFGDPLEALWGKCVFPFCGVNSFERRNFEVVVASTEEERIIWLAEVSTRVGKVFPKYEVQ